MPNNLKIEFSKRRARYGAIKITSGTIAAVVPTRVPTIIFVKGNINTIKIINGTDRTVLTIVFVMV